MRRSHAITTIALSALAGTAGTVVSAASGHASTTPAPRVAFMGWNQTDLTVNDVITVAGSDGSNPTTMNFRDSAGKSPCTAGCNEIRYSPDGTRVTFLAGTGQTTSNNPAGDLWIADDDGSNAHVLVEGSSLGTNYEVAQTSWSPDSATIYFTGRWDTVAGMWQINADGTGFRQFPAPWTYYQRNPDVLADGRVAYLEGMTVKVYDPKTGAVSVLTTREVLNQFAVSPDGKQIAIVDYQPSGFEIYNVDGSGQPVQVTLPGVAVADPVWSPDGSAIAYVDGLSNTAHAKVHTISDPAGTDTDLTALMGQTGGGDVGWAPAARPTPTPTPAAGPATVHRIRGTDRYATARLVSQAQWAAGSANAVVLARGDQAPDALAGVPLAAHMHGPLLLTDPNSLDRATNTEIARVTGGPSPAKTIYILGGDAAVSPSIESSLRSAGYHVIRYQGADRYRTALAVAGAFGNTSHVIVATGRNFPDALAAGPLGAVENAPIVLSDDNTFDPATAAFVLSHQEIDPVGGYAQRAVATLRTAGRTVDGAVSGPTRYGTAAAVASAVAQATGRAPAAVGVASGATFPDALTGGAYAANAGIPLLITEPTTLSSPSQARLSGWINSLTAVTVFGGHAAVSDSVLGAIAASVHGKIQ